MLVVKPVLYESRTLNLRVIAARAPHQAVMVDTGVPTCRAAAMMGYRGRQLKHFSMSAVNPLKH